ncbi:D-alanine--D-alanine ligase [Leptospira langatensis]|uniref:D-alanine--D-alanine ligase n=1 Tax=Leptospira langatensis TaxID=2484983 RepID=A0A5F1ZWF8_9LEPT|nr:D-alanine--D-alanine ligase [Leptospira langatensis]TGJ98291.1 D-alanine--D-alanine ligase [Leptospira langatensis]TGL43205.1 D-alanine--D-alanine ligase [Leptospira langatensis]
MTPSSFPSVLIVADIQSPNFEKKNMQEWEDLESVLEIRSKLEELGEKVEILESPSKLLQKLSEFSDLAFEARPVLFHLVEGFLSRNREALLPSLAEFAGFPHTGSDAYAQTLSLDKHLSKLTASSLGIPTASWGILEINSVEDPTKFPNSQSPHPNSSSLIGFRGSGLPSGSEFPIFLKPRFEGSSLGIGEENQIIDISSLQEFLDSKLRTHSSWIWETYLPGEEWTVAVIGSTKLGYRVSSVARIDLEGSPEEVYGEITKTKLSMPEKLHFDLDENRSRWIQEASLALCRSVGTSGAVRLDWKADRNGVPNFLEWNLTPGLSSYYSSYPICYSMDFGSYSQLLAELLMIAREDFTTERFSYSRQKTEKETGPYSR